MNDAAIVFDGDDTLWLVEHLYDEARADAAAVVAAAGIDPVRWDVLEREIDVRNVERLGVSALRFPTSCVEAYVVAANEQGKTPRGAVSERVRTAATAVFERPAPVVDEAEVVVEQLRSRYSVVLLTKGEPWVQRRRIAQSGLDDAFDLVLIVESKSETEFVQVLREIGASASPILVDWKQPGVGHQPCPHPRHERGVDRCSRLGSTSAACVNQRTGISSSLGRLSRFPS